MSAAAFEKSILGNMWLPIVDEPWWWLPAEQEGQTGEGDKGAPQGQQRPQPHPTHGWNLGFHMPQWWHLPYFLHPHSVHRQTSKTDPSTGISEVTFDKEKFQIKLSVPHFSASDLKIRITENHDVIIDGCHEEKEDEHGLIARSFTRKYLLPKDVDPKEVVSELSADGILTVTAPRKPQEPDKEIQIPILAKVEAEKKPLP